MTKKSIAAVAGIGDGTVEALATFLVANELVDDVLLYHVTDGRRFANSVVPRDGVIHFIDNMLVPLS